MARSEPPRKRCRSCGRTLSAALAAEETLAGLRRYRNPSIFQRLLEAPQVRSRGRKQRNVAGAAGALAAIRVLVADHHVADEPAARIRHAFRLCVAQHRRTRSYL